MNRRTPSASASRQTGKTNRVCGVEIASAAAVLHSVVLPRRMPENFGVRELRRVEEALSPCKIPFGDFTDFQQRVWKQLLKIPRGRVMSYAQIAASIGKKGAARAVGSACAANPFLIAVPCHRVVAKDGLGGYAYGLAWKKKLLELEGALPTH